jgi:CARDB protein
MRRLLLASAAFFALVPTAHAAAPRAVLVACDRVGHEAVFDGRMDAVPHTDRMRMRFVLQDRTPGHHRWSRVPVPGFGAWQTSDPGRSRYVYTKRVQALVGPAAYRVQVRFRWIAEDGIVLQRARAVSPRCRQPDPRADLSVFALDVQGALRPTRRRYAVTVVNSGRSGAEESSVQLDLGDGGAPLTATVDPLPAGESRTVAIAGRACTPGALLVATADATDAVDEHDEADDVLALTCPAAGP